MLLWIGFSGFYNFFALLILALIVYFNNSKNKTIRSFVVFSFFTSFWSLCYFFPLVQDSKELSFLSFRLLHVFALFIATTHLQYICNFLDIYVKYRALILFGYVFNLLILPFVPTALFIRDVVPKYSFNYWADIGPIYSVWLFVWIFYVVFSTYLLAKYYLKSTGIKKQQINIY